VYHFECNHEQFARFFFTVDKPTIVLIETWPLDEDSDPDLYVAHENKAVDKNVYHWKSNNIGADKVLLQPETPNFTTGTLWIAVEGFRQNLNKLAIRVKAKDYKPMYDLLPGEPVKVTISDIEFFKYHINA